jgi:putative FmdB family regulatory protein
MPIYEYHCGNCNTIYQFLVKTVSGDVAPVCPRCGTGGLARVMSRFSTTGTRSDDGDLDRMADDLTGLDESDPRAMARAVRKMADRMGEELGPELEHALGRLEAGESPEEVERELEALGFGDEEGTGGAPSGPPHRDPGLYEA